MSDSQQLFTERQWQAIVAGLDIPRRQSEIVCLLMLGMSDKQIAQELGISLSTVRTHLSRLFERFNIGDRVELILTIFRYYMRNHRRIES